MSGQDNNRFLEACRLNWAVTVEEMLTQGHDPEASRSVRGGRTYSSLHGAVLWSALDVVDILIGALKKKHEKNPEKLIASLADGRMGDRGEFESTGLMMGKSFEGIAEGNRLINDAIAEAIATLPDKTRQAHLAEQYLPDPKRGKAI